MSSVATKVSFSQDQMFVALGTGATLELPVARYPRLWMGTAQQRLNYKLIGSGEGIHWPDLDEDLLVDDLEIHARKTQA